MKAQCQCEQLSVDLPASDPVVVACHCVECQRRTGSPFGVLAYYPAEDVVVRGEPRTYRRLTATGGTFDSFFCPSCGSTVYAKASKKPEIIGVAIGAITDPAFKAPDRSVWERTRHHWVAIPGDIARFPKGRS